MYYKVFIFNTYITAHITTLTGIHKTQKMQYATSCMKV